VHLAEKPLMAGLESPQVLERRRGHLRSRARVERSELRDCGASEAHMLHKRIKAPNP